MRCVLFFILLSNFCFSQSVPVFEQNGRKYFGLTSPEIYQVVDTFATLSSCRLYSDSLKTYSDSLEIKLQKFRKEFIRQQTIILTQDSAIKNFQVIVGMKDLQYSDCMADRKRLRTKLFFCNLWGFTATAAVIFVGAAYLLKP